MSQSRSPERRLLAFLEEGPAILSDRVLQDVRQEVHRMPQRTRRDPLHLRLLRFAPVVGAALVVGIVAIGIAWAMSQLDLSVGDPPSAAPSPSAPAIGPEQTLGPVEWTGDVRVDAGGMPMVPMMRDTELGELSWTDAQDADAPWVDITRLRVPIEGRAYWDLDLGDAPPRADGLDPAETVISYGLVFETTGDGIPDYVVGINNDAPTPGEFRVWVTDLATGDKDERVGGPYGFPVEFRHPDEQAAPDISAPSMHFTFLRSPLGVYPASSFYAWASVTSGGEIVAWDYAPEYGWLVVPPDGER